MCQFIYEYLPNLKFISVFRRAKSRLVLNKEMHIYVTGFFDNKRIMLPAYLQTEWNSRRFGHIFDWKRKQIGIKIIFK